MYLKLVMVPSLCPFRLPLDAIDSICIQFAALRPCAGVVDFELGLLVGIGKPQVIFLPSMLTFLLYSSRAPDLIRTSKMLKMVGDKRQSCFTPTVVLKHSPMLP